MSEQPPRPSHAAYWDEQIRAWRASGQSQLGFCKQQGLSYSRFQYWRRKLARASDEGQTLAPRSGFIPVRRQWPTDSAGLTLVLPNGAELRGICADNLVLVERLLRFAG